MRQVEADVVILSAGTAGLAAAVTAAEAGMSVIAFEKSGHTGGNALRANQVFAVESKLQRLKQYTLTREQAFKIFMDFTQWSVDARLVRKFIDKSAGTLDWLERMGVEFFDLTSHGPGNNYTSHIVKEKVHRPGLGGAAVIVDTLTERADKLGIQIFFKTPAKQIIKKGGKIIGTVAENSSGEIIRAKAKAVIIATGGFGAYFRAPFGISGLDGDGIRMAQEVGAEATEGTMARPGTSRRLGSPRSAGGPMSVFATFMYPHFMVNLLGERFIDEEVNVITPIGGNAIYRQKEHCAFSIFDENTKRYFMETDLEYPVGFGIAQFGEPVTRATNFDTDLKQILDRGSDTVFVADSVAELASKTGINLQGLLRTLEEYNKACETGRDEVFNKKIRYLRPVKKPRFYALKRSTSGMGAPEGIKINHRTEVLTKDFEVIPGLYAVGMDAACNIYRDVYPNVLPGNAMGFSLNSGRMAAENAALYVKSVK